MGCEHIFCKKNSFARFVPCAAHSLNLAGAPAASVNNAAIAFFGKVQRFFMFPLISTSRWEILMKGYSETRWTSKASGIKTLYSQTIEVCKVLNDIV
jgi:hypothetical protein